MSLALLGLCRGVGKTRLELRSSSLCLGQRVVQRVLQEVYLVSLKQQLGLQLDTFLHKHNAVASHLLVSLYLQPREFGRPVDSSSAASATAVCTVSTAITYAPTATAIGRSR